MRAREGYKRYVDWDELATEQGWQPEWVKLVGESVGLYLNECVMYGTTPTFDSFFAYIEPKSPKSK